MRSNFSTLAGAIALFAATATAAADPVLDESFDSYGDGPIVGAPNAMWQGEAGTDGFAVNSGALELADGAGEAVRANLPITPVGQAFFASLWFRALAAPTSADGAEFAHFATADGQARARLFLAAGPTPDTVRIGLASAANGPAIFAPQTLIVGSDHLLIVRHELATGIATVWIDPSGPDDPRGTMAPDVTDARPLTAVVLRQSPGLGHLALDRVQAGMSFRELIFESIASAAAGTTLTFTPSNPSNPKVAKGAQHVVVAGFTVTATGGSATLNNIQITTSGSGDDKNGITDARLVRDSNANGQYDSASDTVTDGTRFDPDNGTKTFSAGGTTINDGQTVRFFVVYFFADDAKDGEYALSLHSPSVDAGTTVSGGSFSGAKASVGNGGCAMGGGNSGVNGAALLLAIFTLGAIRRFTALVRP